MTIALFLADDHIVVRDGLRLLLEKEPDFRVIGEAGDGREAVSQVFRLCPDVVLMDIAMPELNGIEATQQISEACPESQVIILSMHASAEHAIRALQAGARGYVLKESVGAEIVKAIRTVFAGQRYLNSKIVDRVINGHMLKNEMAQAKDPLARLSTREREVLQLVVEGKSSGEIAAILSLAPGSVDTYRSRLMDKLNIHDLPGLVKFAIQQGLISLE